MTRMFVVTDAQRTAMYIMGTEKERDMMLEHLMNEYPRITFYTGCSDKHTGAVYWDVPAFPK